MIKCPHEVILVSTMVFIPKLSIALDMYNLGQCKGILDKKDAISSGPHPHNNRELKFKHAWVLLIHSVIYIHK